MGEGGYFDQMFPYIHELVFCIKVSFYNKYIIIIVGLFIHVYKDLHPYRMADTCTLGVLLISHMYRTITVVITPSSITDTIVNFITGR